MLVLRSVESFSHVPVDYFTPLRHVIVQVITASVLLPFVLYMLCDIMEFGRALCILLSSYRADDVGGLSGLFDRMAEVISMVCWLLGAQFCSYNF